MRLEFHTLDVFTKIRFGGNPLAVVMDADQLETGQMQTIAREFNLSETIFLSQPSKPAHTARVRIFTPGTELPFAGHPTVGAAILLAEKRAETTGNNSNALVTLEQKLGVVRVGVRPSAQTATFAEFDAPVLPVVQTDRPAKEEIAAAVGLLPSEIGYANHEPVYVKAGNTHLFVPVASRDAIARAAPNLTRWSALDLGQDGVGAYLYTNRTEHREAQFHARMFAPNHGILEDPATGSATAAFAAALQAFDQPRDGHHKRLVEQGYEMGRPSQLYLSWDVAGQKMTNVRIGGYAVRVCTGQITV